jgi:hypothetical protein
MPRQRPPGTSPETAGDLAGDRQRPLRRSCSKKCYLYQKADLVRDLAGDIIAKKKKPIVVEKI